MSPVRCLTLFAAIGTLFVGNACAQAWTSADDTVRALQQGRCEAAVDAANKGLMAGEPQAYFVVGLMHLKGLCIKAAPDAAVQYFDPAAKAAHTDAAYMLTMMHGMGIGVPQSYAQAGRWTVAMMDIAALKGGASSNSRSAAIDAGRAAAWGVIGTVASVVRDRIVYPKRDARIRSESVAVTLKLEIGPSGLQYALLDADSKAQDDVTSSVRRRSNQPHLEAVEEIVEAAIRELPPFEPPAETLRLSIPYSFNLKR